MQQLRTPPAALRCPLLQVCQYSYFCTSEASALVKVTAVSKSAGGSGSRHIYRTQSAVRSRHIYRTQSAVRVKQARWYTSAVKQSASGGSGSRHIYRTQSAVRVEQVRWYKAAVKQSASGGSGSRYLDRTQSAVASPAALRCPLPPALEP